MLFIGGYGIRAIPTHTYLCSQPAPYLHIL